MESYKRLYWEDSPSTATPLTAENLNHMEEGIEAATNGVTAIEQTVSANKTNTDTEILKLQEDINNAKNEIAGKIDNVAGSVSTSNLATDAVSTSKIRNGAVTYEKIQTGAIAKDRLSEELQNEINGKANLEDVYSVDEADEHFLSQHDAPQIYAGIDVVNEMKNDLARTIKTCRVAITNLSELYTYNSDACIYYGSMSGFSTPFGAPTSDTVLYFTMWITKRDQNTYYRYILFDDGSLWRFSSLTSTKGLTLINYSKNSTDALLSQKYDTSKIENGSTELITDSNLVTSLFCKYQKIDDSVLIQFSFNTAAPTTEAVDISFSGLPFRNDSQVSGVCITPTTKLMCSVLVSSYNTTMTVSLPAGIKKGERIATSLTYKIY